MRHRIHARLLLALSLMFLIRIAGQAVQRWMPQSFLPPFDAFQGSSLPYELLLLIQIIILFWMLRMTWKVSRDEFIRNERTGRILAWVGGIYMAGSVTRILIGIFFPDADTWFKAEIPVFFHLVLAGFLIILAKCHLNPSRPEERKA